MLQIVVPALLMKIVVAGQAVHDVAMDKVFQAYRALVVRAQVLRDCISPLALWGAWLLPPPEPLPLPFPLLARSARARIAPC